MSCVWIEPSLASKMRPTSGKVWVNVTDSEQDRTVVRFVARQMRCRVVVVVTQQVSSPAMLRVRAESAAFDGHAPKILAEPYHVPRPVYSCSL